jgi:hypothetical protein
LDRVAHFATVGSLHFIALQEQHLFRRQIYRHEDHRAAKHKKGLGILSRDAGGHVTRLSLIVLRIARIKLKKSGIEIVTNVVSLESHL